MEVTIGVVNVPRELTVETDLAAAEVLGLFKKALADAALLELPDVRGRVFAVPAAAVGYVEIGPETGRKVGFGG